MDDNDDREIDPEAQADIELRERTARERTRKRPEEIYNWSRPLIVDRWLCRGKCGQVVTVTAEAQHALEVNDRELVRRGERPLDANTIAFCDSCRAKGLGMQADRNRKHVDAVAALIRELRGGTTAPEKPGPPPSQEREWEIMKSLRLMNHPDVDSLVRAIRESRDGAGKKSTRLRLT